MLGEWIAHASTFKQDAVGIMVRRTRTELIETIERSKRIYGQLGAVFNETEKHWRFKDGARLRFAYLERDSDADGFQGHGYTRVYVEEAGTFPSDKPILKLMATLRSGAGAHVGIRLTGNPGGPGQQWVKNRYIDPCPSGYKVFTRTFENPFNGNTLTKDWTFIPARVTDNAYLSQDYIAQLQMVGSKQLVQAWLTGDFSIVEGAFFDNWSEARHVIPRFDIPQDWTRFRSMDWGSASPFSVGWWAVAGDDHVLTVANPTGVKILPRGCLVRYREWYGAKGPNEGLKLTAEEVAEGIKVREIGETIAYGVLDPSAFAESGGPSIAERMSRLKVYFRPADNRRVGLRGAMGGWDQLRNRLHGEADDKPMLVTFDTCVDSIRTIPVLQHDPNRIEDVDTEAEDHAADEWRYACMSRPYNRTVEKPEKKPFEDYVPSIDKAKPYDWAAF